MPIVNPIYVKQSGGTTVTAPEWNGIQIVFKNSSSYPVQIVGLASYGGYYDANDNMYVTEIGTTSKYCSAGNSVTFETIVADSIVKYNQFTVVAYNASAYSNAWAPTIACAEATYTGTSATGLAILREITQSCTITIT